jgi:hypothetical protein
MTIKVPRRLIGETRDAYTTAKVLDREKREIQGNNHLRIMRIIEKIQDAEWPKCKAPRPLPTVSRSCAGIP